MTLPFLLLILRIISAFLLLSFLFAIAWIAYQDLRFSAKIATRQNNAADYLRIISSEENSQLINKVYPLQSVMRIGRENKNTIVIDDDCISNEHLLIESVEGQLWLIDLTSDDRTKLNDKPVNKPTIIVAGDLITVGGTKIMYERINALDELTHL